jgi:hypothetical protein
LSVNAAGVFVASLPSASTARGRRVVSFTWTAGVAVEHLGLPHQAEAEMCQAGEQLPERAWIGDIEIEFAVIDRGLLGDGQSAAAIATVADATW